MSGNFTFCNTSSWDMERTSTLKITTNQAINLSILRLTFPLRLTENRTPLYSANGMKNIKINPAQLINIANEIRNAEKYRQKPASEKTHKFRCNQSINQSTSPMMNMEKSTLISSKRLFCEFFPELHSHAPANGCKVYFGTPKFVIRDTKAYLSSSKKPILGCGPIWGACSRWGSLHIIPQNVRPPWPPKDSGAPMCPGSRQTSP